jgi:hypothetical protein
MKNPILSRGVVEAVAARHFSLRVFRPTITWATGISPNLQGCFRIALRRYRFDWIEAVRNPVPLMSAIPMAALRTVASNLLPIGAKLM